jgi:HPt (histidine-containing phosphotransfer) domain-containing protein
MADPELDALKREFLDEAREKVAEMESKLTSDRSPQSLERLVYLAHQLKGSGGSYGFQRISTEAAELEKAVEQWSSGASAEGVETRVRDYVANLRDAIDRGMRELAPA